MEIFPLLELLKQIALRCAKSNSATDRKCATITMPAILCLTKSRNDTITSVVGEMTLPVLARDDIAWMEDISVCI